MASCRKALYLLRKTVMNKAKHILLVEKTRFVFNNNLTTQMDLFQCSSISSQASLVYNNPTLLYSTPVKFKNSVMTSDFADKEK